MCDCPFLPGRSRPPGGPGLCVTLLLLIILVIPSVCSARTSDFPEIGDYEVFSMAGADEKIVRKKLLKESPRNALNEDGLVGFFVGETADRLKSQRMFGGARVSYRKLNSKYGETFRGADTGDITSLVMSANYIGEWAEWSVTVPWHDVNLAAPRTFNKGALEDQGLGDLRFGWKATYLPDKSYYRWAYGSVITASTGDPARVGPAGPRNQDELKLFGCVTTKEADWAVGNAEIGVVLNSSSSKNRFIYRTGFSYEANKHASLIGELVGEIEGGDDRDTMDIIWGIRLSPTPTSVLEFSYTRNLRTYREYGWDERWEAGTTIRW